MIEFLEVYLPICIYILLIILLVIGIILGIRLIGAMDKVDAILKNIEGKVNSFNGFFSVLDFTTDKITAFSDKIVELFTSLISRIKRKKETLNNDDMEDDDYE
jgi:uncharacterized protein YoxC